MDPIMTKIKKKKSQKTWFHKLDGGKIYETEVIIYRSFDDLVGRMSTEVKLAACKGRENV